MPEKPQDRCLDENPLFIRVSGVFCTTKELLDNIGTASPKVRFETIFKDAQSALNYHSSRTSDPVSITIIENTLKVFESLHNSDQDKSNDRYPAHAAYANMALKRWKEAIKLLEDAQNILENSKRGDYKRDKLVYESNRVICKLTLNENITDNLNLLKNLNDQLKELNNQVDQPKFKSDTLWDKVDELLARPERRPEDKSVIFKWIEKHQKNQEVINWLEVAKIDLDGGSDATKQQSSPGEVS